MLKSKHQKDVKFMQNREIGSDLARASCTRGHFSLEEDHQMRTSALFGAKNVGFFEIYGVFAGQGRE